jgi:hypothetical protein
MEAIIRFKVESEEEYRKVLNSSWLDDETWELYDNESCLVRRDEKWEELNGTEFKPTKSKGYIKAKKGLEKLKEFAP